MRRAAEQITYTHIPSHAQKVDEAWIFWPRCSIIEFHFYNIIQEKIIYIQNWSFKLKRKCILWETESKRLLRFLKNILFQSKIYSPEIY